MCCHVRSKRRVGNVHKVLCRTAKVVRQCNARRMHVAGQLAVHQHGLLLHTLLPTPAFVKHDKGRGTKAAVVQEVDVLAQQKVITSDHGIIDR